MIRVGTAAPPAEGWDIHCHTVFSDGTETPRALLQEARALRLHGVAIADHDTTSGWQDALAASREVRLPLLRGTEITAVDESVSVHMLAFQYDPLNADISEMFASTREARLRRTKRMVELMAQDFPITWDDVLAQVREGKRTTIGRPHIADALVAAGVYETRSDVEILHSHAITDHARRGGRGQGCGRGGGDRPRRRPPAQSDITDRPANRISHHRRLGRFGSVASRQSIRTA